MDTNPDKLILREKTSRITDVRLFVVPETFNLNR